MLIEEEITNPNNLNLILRIIHRFMVLTSDYEKINYYIVE